MRVARSMLAFPAIRFGRRIRTNLSLGKIKGRTWALRTPSLTASMRKPPPTWIAAWLMYRFQRLFPTGDLFEDLARRGGPSEGFGGEVVVFKVSHDSGLQLGDAFEDPPSDAFAGDL